MRRPFITIVSIAAGVLALLFIAAVVAVRSVDVRTLTAPVAQRIKAQTGRDLRIDGAISISPSLEPRIEVHDVALANPNGGDLLRAKRLDIELALLPLLSRRVEVRRIVLTEPVIALETDANGHGNWERPGAHADDVAQQAHAPATTAPNEASSSAPSPPMVAPVNDAASATRTLPAALAVGVLEVDNGVLTYRNGRTGTVTHVDIQHLELHARDPAAPVNAAFRGSVDGVAVALTGNAGPLSQLLERREPYPLTAQGEIGGQATLLKARMVSADTGTDVRDIDFSIGNTRVTGSITTTSNAGRRNIAVALAAPRIALRDLAALPVVASAAANAPVAAAKGAPDAHLIPDQPLPLASLRDSDVTVDANIDEVVLASGERAQAVELKAASSQGRLHLTRLHAAMLGGTVDASGVIDAAGATPSVDLRIAGRELDAGRLLASLGVPREMRGAKATLDISTRGSGASLHAWAASANGEARIVVGPGTMPVAVSDRTSTLWQIASALNPSAARSDAIALRCAVLRLPLHDGIGIAERSIAVETDNLGLDGSGRVDLMHETLELRLHPILRQGSLIATELPGTVRITGAWRAPKVEIDRASTATAIAKLGALAATGGLPAFGAALLRPESSQDGPCAVALGTARAAVARSSASASPETAASPMTDLARGLSKLLPH